LRARRLVWKAISLMTPMIWVIWREDSSIELMAATVWVTTSPECRAFSLASATNCRADWATVEVCWTVAVSSSMAAAVCSREAACISVRRAKSSAAWAISVAPLSTPEVVSPMEAISRSIASTAALKSSRSR